MKWKTILLGPILLLLPHLVISSKRSYYDYTLDYDINTLPGVAGQDYPALSKVPPNDFYCEGKLAGYYADPQFACQVYHKCDIDHRKDSFLCSNGTVFNQKTFVCEWWYSVDCSQSTYYYGLNARLYKKKYASSPSLYQDSRGLVYMLSSPVTITDSLSKPDLSHQSYAKPLGDLLFSTYFKDVKHLAHLPPSSVELDIKPDYQVENKPIKDYESDEYSALPSAEDNSAAEFESQHIKPSKVKIYKAQPMSSDGKVKVQPMEGSKESYEK